MKRHQKQSVKKEELLDVRLFSNVLQSVYV